MDSNKAAIAAIAVISIMLAAAEVMRRQGRRRRSAWTRPWIRRREEGRGVLDMVHRELASEDRDAFKNFLRMTEEQFFEILSMVRDDIQKQDTGMRESMSPEKRLSLTLRFLATGETYRSMIYSTRIHHGTIGGIIPEVCESNYRNLKGKYLKVPQTRKEWEDIANEFETIRNFLMCVGAIDGKHIAFSPPASAGSHYFNCKGSHSIVLLAVADANSSS
ncbi:protein ANTAGONIST OF LIKE HETEROCHROMATIN PROTEIN 1-like [Ischnura elegans]|uniref:protein ANTAGONIST OF LIKE HETEROCHROMATIN PROTEIN 1-like n=1 Tax=Ischnura elegans TaxID=197161 RepID=UPI001ED89777|nr:protein ANTAGONIST OF LIKE HETEROCHROMATIN PROTEIN 1-like [Ischnura elegans]